MDKLTILWVNDNKDTAHTMVFMYAINAKLNNWWSDVEIIVWGASAKLVADDKNIQEKINMAKHSGVKIMACSACAKEFGIIEKFDKIGLETKPMGKYITDLIKNDEKLITI